MAEERVGGKPGKKRCGNAYLAGWVLTAHRGWNWQQSKGVWFGRKRKWQEEKGKCESTFVYGGSGHVVETQSCVHVIHVLQESEEILHLLKCDALHKKNNWDTEGWRSNHSCSSTLNYCCTTGLWKINPKLSWQELWLCGDIFRSSSAVWHKRREQGGQKNQPTHTHTHGWTIAPQTERRTDGRRHTSTWTRLAAATPLMNLFAK